jgi:hypothetical protein
MKTARMDAPLPASLFILGPTSISQPHSRLISISTPSSRTKVLSTFYVAHAVLVEYDAERTQTRYPFPPSRGSFRPRLNFRPSVGKVSMKSISMQTFFDAYL